MRPMRANEDKLIPVFPQYRAWLKEKYKESPFNDEEEVQFLLSQKPKANGADVAQPGLRTTWQGGWGPTPGSEPTHLAFTVFGAVALLPAFSLCLMVPVSLGVESEGLHEGVGHLYVQ